jgi:eukaryotic-like serine/threonine-protein kinase
MSQTITCPDPAQLARLLEGELSEAEQTNLTEHLDGCARCQQAVQELASGGRTWAEVAAYLKHEHSRTEKEPALQQAVAELAGPARTDETQTEPGRSNDDSLDFLTQSTKPGSLGRLDHYEVMEVIGRGGMGVVLKAFDEALHRVVAVKVLSPALATSATARRRFGREAKAAAAVSHDHVVTIHAVEGDKPIPYLVMQCVAGFSLEDKLARNGPLGVKEILRIGMQTADGLAAAHKQGLVHRDIKPANILLENGVERVKITDFGLARAVDDASLTQSGVVAGTPQYMSPEQAQGEPVDHRSDLFSLGSVLYAMCTGRPPFRATGTMAVLKRVCEDTPRPIREINPEISDWLCEIIAKLHAKKPADRFQSATEVADLLSRHLAHLQQPTLIPRPAPAGPLVSEGHPLSYDSKLSRALHPRQYWRALRVMFWLWCILGMVILSIWAFSGPVEDSLFLKAVVAWAGPVLLVSLVLMSGAVYYLLIGLIRSSGLRKLANEGAPPPTRKKWRHLVEAVVFLAIGAAAFAWLDYKHPAWWTELWESGDRLDVTPGTVVVNWNDPDVEVWIEISNHQETETSAISELVRNGWASYSRESPFLQHLNPATYRLRAMKGEKLAHEEEFTLSPGETRLINLPPTTRSSPPFAKAPFTADEAKQHQEVWAKHLGVPVEIENAIGMKFRLIPPGEFLMGMSQEEIEAANKDRPPDHWLVSSTKTSGPQHKVTLSRPFYCATTVVTIGQFRKFVEATGYQTDAEKDGKGGAHWNERQKKMTQDPSFIWKTPGYDVIDNCPVTQVTWNDAVAFCNWLSAEQGLGEAYRSIQGPWWKPTGAQGYRLPTEAQWEFACRAGATTNYFWGSDEGMLRNYAWYSENSSGKTHPVATKAANPFGLFDMQGNVSELCQDFHDMKSYPSVDDIDPVGAPQGTCYVRRGANFASQSKDCASAQRLLGIPFDVRHDDTGFRVVQDILPAVKASPPPLAKAPFTAEEAKAHQKAWAKHLGVPVETTNSEGMKLVLVPPGEFQMGLSAAEIEAAISSVMKRPQDDWLIYLYRSSGPLHKVILSKPYYAATTHLTIGQFREFVKAKKYLTDAERDGKGGMRYDDQQKKMIHDPNLTWKAPGYEVTDDSPVTQITWNDAVVFCNWLSAKEGLAEPYELVQGSWRPTSAPGYRLPTEAQWEFACRAGTTSIYFGGSDEVTLARHAWFDKNSNGKAHPVGAKAPNAFGLFDMQGNASQFCQDFYDPKSYDRNEQHDPIGPDTGLSHVRRGGTWSTDSDACWNGLRMSLDLKDRQGGVGFRIVRDILPPVKASPPPLAKAPFTSEEANQYQNAWAKHLGVPVETTNTAGMKLVLIPPGEFNMGLTAAEIDAAITRIKNRPNDSWLVYAYKTSGPLHKVVLTKPYYAATTHVTIGQFREFVKAKKYLTDAERDGKGGSRWDDQQNKMIQDPKLIWKTPGYDVTDQSPVTEVTWNDTVAFCNWLSAKEGLGQPYELVEGSWRPTPAPGYRLPTEAQWEYACRAGATSLYVGGNDEEAFARYAWFVRNSNGKAQPVGANLPNAFGLFDMQGNADQFCQDFCDPKYYERNERYDPLGPDTGLMKGQPHVRRGSSWGCSADLYLTGLRMGLDLKDRQGGIGFRIVRDILPAVKVLPPSLAKAPFTSDEAKQHQAAWAKHLGVPVDIENAIGTKLRLIPPGEFFMGSTQEEIEPLLTIAKKENWRELIDLLPLEKPRHSVRLTQPFYLGTYEVTQGEYQQVMETNPSHFSASGAGKDKVKGEDTSQLPVESVGWLDAVEFCNRLSKREKRSPCYLREGNKVQILDGTGYRLPTEAEWEYACRAGSTASYCFGDDIVEAKKYAWFALNSEGRTHAVGQKLPNAFGLFDMHGNVWECCQDSFQAYPPSAITNPALANGRVTRGGSWDLSPIECRSSYRGQVPPSEGGDYHHGFRVVLNVAPGMEVPSRSSAAPDLLKDAVLVMNFEKDTFYDKDGKTYVRDLSGHGNDGLCENVAFTPEGRAGGGLKCKNNGSVRLEHSLFRGQDEYTLTAWVRLVDDRRMPTAGAMPTALRGHGSGWLSVLIDDSPVPPGYPGPGEPKRLGDVNHAAPQDLQAVQQPLRCPCPHLFLLSAAGVLEHNKRVRPRLCAKPEDWFWSGAADYPGVRVGPLRLDRESLPVVAGL